LKRWAAKCASESARGAEVIMLAPARTGSRWWQQHAGRADAVCFLSGRLTFPGAKKCAPFPCVLSYWGPRVERFAEVFAPHGLVVRREAVQAPRSSGQLGLWGAP
jgi:hypothetical protein